MDFSIIVPVVHGGPFLQETLASLRSLDYSAREFEVVVGENPNRAAALNDACRRSQGAILVFTDDDCVAPKDWLKVLHCALEREADAGAVGGRDVLAPSDSAFDLSLDFVLNSFLGTGNLRRGDRTKAGRYYPKLWGMAVPREIALAVARDGGKVFDESLPVSEDTDLAARIERAGRRIVYAPEWVVTHHRDTTWGSFARRSFLAGRASRALRVNTLPHLLLAILLVLLLWWPTLLAYLAVLLLEGARAAVRTRRLQAVGLVPGLLLTCQVARALGWLSGQTRGKM
jgi:GT2 family glycosyltransferase